MRVYGILELFVGASWLVFSLAFLPLTARLAPFQGVASSPILQFAIRFFFGAVLILLTAGFMGASFPLIAHAIDGENRSLGKGWLHAYAVNLTNALSATRPSRRVVQGAALTIGLESSIASRLMITTGRDPRCSDPSTGSGHHRLRRTS